MNPLFFLSVAARKFNFGRLKICVYILVIILAATACQKRVVSNETVPGSNNQPIETKVVENEVDKSDEALMKGSKKGSPSNSVIIGRIVEIVAPNPQHDAPCNEVSCRAKVELMAMTKYGASFHGQFSEGEIIEVYFMFTLEETSNRFPELNEPLPGLTENKFFEAELFEAEEEGYSVKLYKLMN